MMMMNEKFEPSWNGKDKVNVIKKNGKANGLKMHRKVVEGAARKQTQMLDICICALKYHVINASKKILFWSLH